METPLPTPDAVLIKLARTGAGISIDTAASYAQISRVRWMQVEAGHETRKGTVRPTRAKPETIAWMAMGVNEAASTLVITPSRMEAEGQNREAAAIMAETMRQEGTTLPGRVQVTDALGELGGPAVEHYRFILDRDLDARPARALRNATERRIMALPDSLMSQDQKRDLIAGLRWALDMAEQQGESNGLSALPSPRPPEDAPSFTAGRNPAPRGARRVFYGNGW